jgi:hypothetical protein
MPVVRSADKHEEALILTGFDLLVAERVRPGIARKIVLAVQFHPRAFYSWPRTSLPESLVSRPDENLGFIIRIYDLR